MAADNKGTTAEDIKCINTIRVLAADTVQKANSGHPGMPMGMAPVAHALFSRHLHFSPSNPKWINRDRWILSNGHGCALQYIMLHLTGYKLTMDDLRNFRQMNSITPGHPECHVTPGVEVTTGPLGQGISNGVGMAMASLQLGALFNKPDFNIIDNHVYVFAGDGCMQEGVASEASSLAGHLKLHNLTIIYDDNKVSIDGETHLSFSEDVGKRYESYGWHVITVEHGDDNIEDISKALAAAREVKDKPTFIVLKTTIGFGSVKAGTEAVHGAPLGGDDIKKLKEKFGFDPAASFVVPADVTAAYAKIQQRAEAEEKKWNELFQAYSAAHPDDAKELLRRIEGKLPAGWESVVPTYKPTDKADATRNISGVVLNKLAEKIPELVGGSADLTPSTKTALKCSTDYTQTNRKGRYLRFGVREHGMSAICNGFHAYGGFIPFGATFLNFIEYGYGAVRLSAVSGHHVIYIMTHDSIGLGEDGPTHQPIEALSLCRATPNMLVIRPADGNEVSAAYIAALKNSHGPTVLALTRQNVPHLKGSNIENALRGAYILQDDSKDKPDLILTGTGSEVSIIVDAAAKLTQAGKKVRVVSFPSWELFDAQPVEYRRSIFTPGVPVVSVEALSTCGWSKYAHVAIGMTTFGTSAPYEQVYDRFGFTAEKIAKRAVEYLEELHKLCSDMGLPVAAGPLPTHYHSAANPIGDHSPANPLTAK